MPPADAPEIPVISSRPSASKWSSTPQVKAPCAPPPWSARLIFFLVGTRVGSRRDQKSAFITGARPARRASLRGPAAVDGVVRAGDAAGSPARKEQCERCDPSGGGQLLG